MPSAGILGNCRPLRANTGGCHPSSRDFVRAKLQNAKAGVGPTLFDDVIEIIRDHGPGGRQSLPKDARIERDASVQLFPWLPVGILGSPVGKFLRVEGELKMSKGPGLLVESVDGEKLRTPVGVAFKGPGKEKLPAGKRLVLRGYETVEMVGVPESVRVAEGYPIAQVGWQIHYTFIVTSVISAKPQAAN